MRPLGNRDDIFCHQQSLGKQTGWSIQSIRSDIELCDTLLLPLYIHLFGSTWQLPASPAPAARVGVAGAVAELSPNPKFQPKSCFQNPHIFHLSILPLDKVTRPPPPPPPPQAQPLNDGHRLRLCLRDANAILLRFGRAAPWHAALMFIHFHPCRCPSITLHCSRSPDTPGAPPPPSPPLPFPSPNDAVHSRLPFCSLCSCCRGRSRSRACSRSASQPFFSFKNATS
jgi:hypothetical protein